MYVELNQKPGSRESQGKEIGTWGCMVDYCIGGMWGKSQVPASLQPTASYYDYCYG